MFHYHINRYDGSWSSLSDKILYYPNAYTSGVLIITWYDLLNAVGLLNSALTLYWTEQKFLMGICLRFLQQWCFLLLCSLKGG